MEEKQEKLCRNDCGFYGNPATKGYCSFCFNVMVSKEQSCPGTGNSTSSSSHSSCSAFNGNGVMELVEKKNTLLKANIGEPNTTIKLNKEISHTPEDDKSMSGMLSGKKSLRCAAKECSRKLGLTDVQCRCGHRFCFIHRYSDRHECSFNYRELGAQEIRLSNPKVVGTKIEKI